MKNGIDCFPNKKEAKERTKEKIEETFWKQIKSEINNSISKAIESERYKITLDKCCNKYYKLIKAYYKKEKHYKVAKLYEDYEDCVFTYEWTGIEIKWN